MKKFLLLSTLAMAAMSMQAEDFSITIGGDDGVMLRGSSTAPFCPINYYYNNGDCQMIYTAAQLEEANLQSGDIIKGLTIYGACTTSQAGKIHGVYTVYMSETENTRFNSVDDIEMSATDKVATTGDYIIPNGGNSDEPEPLIGINLDTPYTYNGGNLLILIEYRSNAWDSGVYWYCYTDRADQLIMRAKDNVSELGGAPWSNQSGLPKMTFACQGGTGVKAVATDSPAVRVMNNAISVDTESAISIVSVNGMNVASVNGTSLDTTSLPAGIYIVTVRNENGVSTQRFVKK